MKYIKRQKFHLLAMTISFTSLRKTYSALFLLIFPCMMYSQGILWEKSIGGRHDDLLMDAQPTPDNGFILAGSSLSNVSGNKTEVNNGDLDYFVWKMNEDGEIEWQKNFGGYGADYLKSVKITKDGGFILGGNSNSNKGNDKTDDCKGQNDFWIIKLNAGGGQQWQKTIGGKGQDKIEAISQTTDGGYIIGGSSSSAKSEDKNFEGYGNLDYWIVKLNSEGTIEWQKTYGGIFIDELRAIEQTNDQGYIVGGYSNSPISGSKSENNIGEGDFWILKLDKKGEIEWQKTLGGNKDDQLSSIHQCSDGNYILGGSSNSENSFEKNVGNGRGTDFWVVKLNQTGKNIWQQTYNNGEIDILTSLVENEDSTILIGGFSKSEVLKGENDEKNINDYFAVKIKSTGEELWRKSVGSSGTDILRKVIETRDGGYLLAGTSNATKKGSSLYPATKSKTEIGNTLEIGNGKNIKALEDGMAKVNEKVKDFNDEVNGFYKEKVKQAQDKINETVKKVNKDSRIKMGLNTSAGNLLNNNSPVGSDGGSNMLDELLKLNDNKLPNSKPSGDKNKNYGLNDFWVVKLKDKSKPPKTRLEIEAYPNPTTTFTNIIVGFNFEKGSISVVNLSGLVMQQFEIKSPTIPIDLSNLPEGVYIVNVKTDKGSQGIKILKSLK